MKRIIEIMMVIASLVAITLSVLLSKEHEKRVSLEAEATKIKVNSCLVDEDRDGVGTALHSEYYNRITWRVVYLADKGAYLAVQIMPRQDIPAHLEMATLVNSKVYWLFNIEDVKSMKKVECPNPTDGLFELIGASNENQ